MPPVPVPLDRLAVPVDVAPGGQVILRGSYYSKHDGSTIDAARTSWPPSAPGGDSLDPGGMFDLANGGFHLESVNRDTHEVLVRATGGDAPGCSLAGVASPCLVLRTPVAARARMLTSDEFKGTLSGGITMEVPGFSAADQARQSAPFLGIFAGAFALAGVGLVALRLRKKRRESPQGQLLALARRVQDKLKGADAVLAAPLARAVDTALSALKAGRVDPASTEGKRVASVLMRVETRLDSHAAETRAEQEREAADELVREVESALEAAEEASAIGAKTAK